MGKSHYHFIFFLCFAFSVSILYLTSDALSTIVCTFRARHARRPCFGFVEFFCKLVAINYPTRILRTSYVLSLTCPHLIFFCFHSLAFVFLSLPPQ